MDPYIESWIWPDFHARLIAAACDRLNPSLPRRYIASTEIFVWRVNTTDKEELVLGGPDLHVSDTKPVRSRSAGTTVVAPIQTTLRGVTRKQQYIKIVDPLNRRIVTVIEILSPANKTGGDDGRTYRLKRQEYIAGGIGLVEIDLLRAGQRPPLGRPVPTIPDYYVLVHWGWEKGHFGIWPFGLRDPLPPVHVPLDPDVPDVILDLRACMDHVYDFGRYGEQLDYSRPPSLPLRKADATWARKLLKQRSGPID